MNCIYCGKPAGFMKSVHKECENQYKELICKRDEIAKLYACGTGNKKFAYNEILTISKHPFVQKSFEYISDRIKGNEIIIKDDSYICVFEYKNHCSMVRTGLSYARYPIYQECKLRLGLCTIIITDKMINIIPDRKNVKRVSFAMNKIIDIKMVKNRIIVEVKTTSPVPHRVELEYKYDLDSIFGLIKVFTKL